MISRIMDKSAHYTIVQLMAVLKEIDMTKYDAVQICSDVGTHFRSLKVLGTYAQHFLAYLQTVKKHYWDLRVFFGPEEHFKNEVDTFFSELRECTKQELLSTDIWDDVDLVNVYTKFWEEARRRNPLKPPCKFVLFEPDLERKAVRIARLIPKTLPAMLTGCHRWSFRINDKRRTNMVVKGNNLKAVDVRCFGFVGTRVEMVGKTCDAQVEDRTATDPVGSAVSGGSGEMPTEEAPAADSDAESVDEAVTLKDCPLNVKEWKGWKISYKQVEPQKVGVEKIAMKISRKRARSTDKPFSTAGAHLTKTLGERAEYSAKRVATLRQKAELKKAANVEPW